MYFSLQKLFSLLILASPGLFSPVQQAPLPLNCNSDVGTISDHGLIRDVDYGYKGPGVYHITSSSDLYNLALGDKGSGDGASTVVWKSNDTDSQRWYISDVGSGYVTVANNGTGVLLSVNTTQAPTRTYYSSPGKLEARWRLDNYSSTGESPHAVRLTSAKYTNEILAVYNRISQANGTNVYNWPIAGQNLNEAWLLEYLGAR